MPWPEKRNVIGSSVPRIDGPLKVSGRAKYAYDRNLAGMLHGKILRSPHAHAKIISIDFAPAEAMPGVRATHRIKEPGATVFFAGDEVAAIAAETEEVARDAIRAIRVEYEVLPHIASEDDGLRAGGASVRDPVTDQAGDVDAALAAADVTIEGIYGAPVITHVCLETHGLVAHWIDEQELAVYASTQAVTDTATALRTHFSSAVPGIKVTCNTPFMGGGFGSKFGPGVEGVAAAELARKARRPVKLLLERDEEHLAVGNRPSAYARVKAGGTRDGVLTAMDFESWGTGGNSRGAAVARKLPYIYSPPNHRRSHRDVMVHAGDNRAMRAPGDPEGALITEQAIDDLADALGIDPVEFRLKNLPENSPKFVELKPIYTRELELGAAAIGWRERRHPRGDKSPGPIKRGLGCALSTWGGGPGRSQASCAIYPSGQVEVRCGTQDIGPGTTTLVTIVAAEMLGLKPADIIPLIGSSAYPASGGSGGSTTVGGVSLSVSVASEKARGALFDAVAPKLGVGAAELRADGGRIFVASNPERGLSWRQACALLGVDPITAQADRREGSAGMASQGVGGAQFADVSVDIETGQVRLERLVAVADCGMVMNRLLCESQVIGGVVMGINYALLEERRLDRETGRMLNADMEWYKLAGHSDLGVIEVHLLDYPERGVIGIGEPPTIPTAPAIANAVTNAIGLRIGMIPLTPRRVLDALGRA